MADRMNKDDVATLKEMKKKIDDIEKAAQELNELGKGLPVVEKNVRAIVSITHALKFGISDVAEMMN